MADVFYVSTMGSALLFMMYLTNIIRVASNQPIKIDNFQRGLLLCFFGVCSAIFGGQLPLVLLVHNGLILLGLAVIWHGLQQSQAKFRWSAPGLFASAMMILQANLIYLELAEWRLFSFCLGVGWTLAAILHQIILRYALQKWSKLFGLVSASLSITLLVAYGSNVLLDHWGFGHLIDRSWMDQALNLLLPLLLATFVMAVGRFVVTGNNR